MSGDDDDIFGPPEGEDAQLASLNVGMRAGDDPERAARLERSAKILGLPSETAQRNPVEVTRRVATTTAAQTLSNAPATAWWLADGDNAAVGHDQMKTLSGMEMDLMKVHPTAPAPDWMKAIFNPIGGQDQARSDRHPLFSGLTSESNHALASILRGIPDLFNEVLGPGDFVPDPDDAFHIKEMKEMAERGLEMRHFFYQLADAAEGSSKMTAPQGNTRREQVGRFVGGVIPYAATFEAAPFAMASSGADQAGQDAQAKGVYGTKEADQAIGANAVLQGVLGKLPVGSWLESLAPALSRVAPALQKPLVALLTRFGLHVAGGALTGTAMNAGSNIVEANTFDPGKAVFDDTTGGSAGSMALLSGFFHIAGMRAKAADSQVRVGAFNDAADKVADSPLATRAPERLQTFLKAATGEQDVFMPADKLREFLQSPTDLEALSKRLEAVDPSPEDGGAVDRWLDRTGIGEQLKSAVGPGADIIIPAHDYLANVATTPMHEALAEHVRLDADGMSLHEAEHIDDYIKAFVDEHAKETEEAANQEPSPASKVEQAVFSQLRAAGYTIDAARINAQVPAARYETRAARLPGAYTDAFDAFQKGATGGGWTIRSEVPKELGAQLQYGRADAMIDALRQGSVSESKPGASLLEFISRKGGINDTGGELARLDAGEWHKGKKFRGRLLRPDGRSLGDMAVAAQEAGYLHQEDSRQTNEGFQGATQAELTEAIRKELAGEHQFAASADPRATDFKAGVDQLDNLLGQMGLDPTKHSNEDIKQALATYQQSGDRAYQQASIRDVVKAAADKASEAQAALGVASPWLRNEMVKAGIKVKAGGLHHTLDVREVRHIIRNHGDAAKEAQRGQEAVTDADFEHLPDLLAEPDMVALGAVGKNGAGTILYSKNIGGGSTLIAEEIQSGQGRLAVRSIWKYSTVTDAARLRALAGSNARNAGGAPIHIVDVPAGEKALDRLPVTQAAPGEFAKGFVARVLADHPEVKLDLSDNGETATLSRIEVPGAEQGKGIGTEIMKELAHEADLAGVRVALTPDGAFGGNVARLTDFYKRFGFTENRGRQRSFSTKEAMVRNPPGRNYDQSGGGGARGSVSFSDTGPAIVRLFKSKDLSTFLHEGAGHIWLEELRADASHPDAPPQLRADWAQVEKWFGIEPGGAVETVHHEQFARAVEQYFMEGKAPSEGLRGVFQRFAAWLTRIYKSFKALNVPMTPEIRSVLDRLLATDDQIAAANAKQGLNPIFATAEDGGMTDHEFAAYSKAVEDSNSSAKEKLFQRLMGDIRRTRTKEWAEQKKAVREEIEPQINARPDIRAFDYLTKGQIPGLAEDQQPGAHKLNRDAITAIYGDKAVLDRLPKSVPPIYVAEGGVHPDAMAEAMGFKSGEEMLSALIGLEDSRRQMRGDGDRRGVRQAALDQAVEQEMVLRHGDALNDGSIEQEAMDALHNDTRLRLAAIEVRSLGKKAGEDGSQWNTALAQKWAEGVIRERPVGLMHPDSYLRAERQAGVEAQRLLQDGQTVKALERKRQQVLNGHLYRAARDARVDADKQIARLGRIGARVKLASTDQDYLNQAHGLVGRFGFKVPRNVQDRPPIATWLQDRTEAYDTIHVPEWLQAEGLTRDFNDLNIGQLADLHDSVQSVLHAGRAAKNVTVEGRKVALADFTMQVRKKTDAIKDIQRSNAAVAKRSLVRDTSYAFMKVETLFDHLDGNDSNGPMNRLFIQRAADANIDRMQLQKEVSEKITAARNEIPAEIRRTWLDKVETPGLTNPDNGEPLEMTRYDLLSVMLNTGTESNFDKMLRGMKWEEANVNAALAKLRPEERAFVFKLWDAVGGLWPRIATTERALSGLTPEAVKPRMVQTPEGEREGGYWPLARDPIRAGLPGGGDPLEAMFNSSFSSVATPKGHTISRTGAAYPISLDLDHVLGKHLADVTTRVAYGPFIADSMRTLRHQDFKRLLADKAGIEANDLVVDWLRRQVGYRLINPRSIALGAKFLRAARINTMTVQTGFSLVVGAEHAAAYAQTIGKIGPQYTALGVGRYLSNPFLNAKHVFDRSPEMVASMDAQNLELRDQMNDLNSASLRENMVLKGALTPLRVAQRASHGFISMISQYTVRIPTWLGAESKGLAEGMTPQDAARYADKVVRTTHGTGFEKDLPKIQSLGNDMGAEAAKLLTMYRGYHLTQLNQLMEAGYKVSRGERAGGLHQAFWIGIAAPIISGALLMALKGGLPQDPAAWAEFTVDEIMRGAWAPIPIAGDIANAGLNVVEGKPPMYEGSPVVRAVATNLQALNDLVRVGAHAVGKDEDKDLSSKALQHWIEAPGYWLGLPTGQIARIAQNAADIQSGKVETTGPVDEARHLAYGSATKH